MRAVYFDCFSGVSGNMILGALLELGADVEQLRQGLGGLAVGGYRLEAGLVRRGAIGATHVDVLVEGPQPVRHLADVLALIDQGTLSLRIKATATAIFRRLAEAEARVHRCPVEEVHFHEVGAVDAIVDVVGAAFLLEALGARTVYASAVNVGSGRVETAHGTLPVPAPATLELLRGAPVYSGGEPVELATPTGAAILATLARSFGPLPAMRVEGIGYGAGTRELATPNVLRAVLGELTAAEAVGEGVEADRVVVLETNLDDLSPQVCAYVLERLLAEGALDAFYAPITMKKSRPAVALTALARPADAERLLSLIFRETTTLGVRVGEVARRCLRRELRTVRTPYGEVRVKVATRDGQVLNVQPEFEDLRRLAERHGVPLKQLYDEVKREERFY